MATEDGSGRPAPRWTGVGAAAEGIVRALGSRNPALSEAARVKAAWNRAVDARVRAHVAAVYVVPGSAPLEVVVYTDTPIWASELNMQVELMRLKLNMEIGRMVEGRPEQAEFQALGGEWVGKLRFAASREKYLARDRRRSSGEQLEEEEAEARGVDPVPLTADELASLRSETGKISDARLREAAFGAAKASLEWRKGLDAARGRGDGE